MSGPPGSIRLLGPIGTQFLLGIAVEISDEKAAEILVRLAGEPTFERACNAGAELPPRFWNRRGLGLAQQEHAAAHQSSGAKNPAYLHCKLADVACGAFALRSASNA
jgi:hypothetical protein